MKPVSPVHLSSGSGSESARCHSKFSFSLGDRVEVFDVEGLAQAARAVPEAHLALRVQPPELVEDVRAHRRHARAAADEDHLVVGLAGEELAVGTGDDDLVARLQAEDVGRHQPGRHVRRARRRRGDAHVEHDDALLVRVVRHRVGAHHRLVDLRDVAPLVELVPVPAVLLLDVEVLVLDLVRRGTRSGCSRPRGRAPPRPAAARARAP